ncbi:MAG: gliding motility-associated C-terminal domain-containing protein [Flavobacteriales bacterium]
MVLLLLMLQRGLLNKEYRNGNLIGITRRDMQIFVVDCPNNPTPNLNPSSGVGKTEFTIEEGEELCIDIAYEDANNNDLELNAFGEVFDNNIVNPTATINSPITGTGTVSTEFCWNTACGQARDLPYLFNIKVEDNGCPPKTKNSIFEIKVDDPQPPTSLTGKNPVCENKKGVLYSVDSISGYTFNWNVTGGMIDSGKTTNEIAVNWGGVGSGEVSVAAENSHGCISDTISKQITISEAPEVDAGKDTTICSKKSLVLGGNPTGPNNATYSWLPERLVSDASIQNPATVKLDSSQKFIVSVIDEGSCIVKDSMNVSVIEDSLNAGNDTMICKYDTIRLSAQGGDNYYWSPDSLLVNNNVPNPKVFPQNTTHFVLMDTFGVKNCSYSDTVMVEVDSLPYADAGDDTSLCKDDTIQIGGDSTLTTDVDYTWEPDSVVDTPNKYNTLVYPSSSTDLVLNVVDSNNCKNKDTVNLKVNTLPIVSAGNDTSVCKKDTVQLNGQSNGVEFEWSDSGSVNNDTILNPFSVPTDTNIYTLKALSSKGCSNFDSVKVAVDPIPLVDAGEDLWMCPGDTIQLSANGSGNFKWSPTASLTQNNISDPNAFPDTSTKYVVSTTDTNSCSNEDTVTVKVNNDVPINIGNDTTLCKNDTIKLGGDPTSPTGTNYSWTPSNNLSDTASANPLAFPENDKKYILSVSNDTCTNKDSVELEVNIPAKADAGMTDTTCGLNTVNLNGSIGGGASSLTWHTSGSGIFKDSTSANTDYFPSKADTSSGMLSLFLSTDDPAGPCPSDTDSIRLIMDTPVKVDAGNSTKSCESGALSLNGQISGGINKGVWSSLGDGSFQDSTILNTNYIYGKNDKNAGNVAIVLTSKNPPGPCGIKKDTLNINVIEEPKAMMDTNGIPTCKGLKINFSNKSENYDSIEWKIKDSTITTDSPEHIFSYEQESNVYLIAQNDGVCQDTSKFRLDVYSFKHYFSAFIPNVFSPNNDNMNDKFRIKFDGEYSECTNLKIFNRWGQLMFRSVGFNAPWQGKTPAGKDVPQGTYIYSLKVGKIKFKGDITLLR